MIVGPAAAHVDLDVGLFQGVRRLPHRANDAGKRGRHVGEVGDAAADEQRARAAVGGRRRDRQQRLGVGVGFGFGRGARVLGVVA